MATIIPPSELLRRALTWLEEQRVERPEVSLTALLDEAGMRFNLGPQDCQWLERILRQK